YVVRQLNRRRIAFLCVREYPSADSLGPLLRKNFDGAYIANEKLTQESAAELVASGGADAVAFGKMFLANPDLPRRLQLAASLNPAQPESFYGGGQRGYTDYPALA